MNSVALAAGIVGVGFLLGVLGVVLLIRFWMFSGNAKRVPGRFLGYYTHPPDLDNKLSYAPIVAFVSPEGVTQQVTLNMSIYTQPFRVGQPLTLMIDPVHPNKIKIAEYTQNWFGPLILIFVGGLFVVIGAFLMVVGPH